MRTEPSTELSANQFSFRIAPSTYDIQISTVLPRISALGTAADDKWCRVQHEPVLFRPVNSVSSPEASEFQTNLSQIKVRRAQVRSEGMLSMYAIKRKMAKSTSSGSCLQHYEGLISVFNCCS